MTTLIALQAREVLDSRGRPTVEVEALGADGSVGRALVPSEAGGGRHGTQQPRAGGDRTRVDGPGVRRAVALIGSTLAPAVRGWPLADQEGLDAALLDLAGTAPLTRLGTSARLAVSLAVARAAARAQGEPLFRHLNRLWAQGLDPETPSGPALPLPLVPLIADGRHPDLPLDFQAFLAVPTGARSYSEALAQLGTLHLALGQVLDEYGEEAALVSDEGAYGPRLRSESYAVDRILTAAGRCGLEPGRDLAIALEVEASRLRDPVTGRYRLLSEAEPLDSEGMVALLEHWSRQYPLVSIEDGLAADDWDGWGLLTARLGGRIQLLGHDLFGSQPDRLERGIQRGAGNAVRIQPHHVGTVSETLAVLRLARRHGYRCVLGAGSGETEDASLADLAVATAADQVQIGALARSERLAKYNQLLRIEEQLGGPTVAPFGCWPVAVAV